MNLKLPLLAAVASLALSGTAYADITFTKKTSLPTASYTTPTSATNAIKTTGSEPNVKASPFPDAGSPYELINANGSATYDFGSSFTQLALVWGTPDDFNKIELKDGSSIVGTFTGFDLTGLSTSPANYFVTLTSTKAFDSVVLSSTGTAFEEGNVSPVPLPASLPMFGASLLVLGGLALVAKRKVTIQSGAMSLAA